MIFVFKQATCLLSHIYSQLLVKLEETKNKWRNKRRKSTVTRFSERCKSISKSKMRRLKYVKQKMSVYKAYWQLPMLLNSATIPSSKRSHRLLMMRQMKLHRLCVADCHLQLLRGLHTRPSKSIQGPRQPNI